MALKSKTFLPLLKSKLVANFLVDNPCLKIEANKAKGVNLLLVSLDPLRLIYDISYIESKSEVKIVIILPVGWKTQLSF